jgi:N-acetylmuramoyl-L-alanine amidase
MSARRLTRRSLLAGTAGAAAGSLVRPGGVLAALAGPPRPVLDERRLGHLQPGTVTIELARVADLIGVEWQAPAAADIELRFRLAGGSFSRWASAGVHGHGPDGPAPAQRLVGDPVWSGGTTAVQIRSSRALSGVCLQLVDVSGGVGARRRAGAISALASAALQTATPVLAAGPGQPPIIARRAWAAGVARPRVAPEYGAVEMAFVHHTENPNGYTSGEVPAMLRAIYAFHRYTNGWNDIGYNFVIDQFGRIFEARAGGIDEPVVGAHAGGYNLVSTGVAVLGSFSEVPVSTPARAALERLLAWKLSLHGVSADGRVTVRVNPAGARYSRFRAGAHVPLAHISGHRDADSTDCPGNALYGELTVIRRSVRTLAGRPARSTLALTAGASAGAGVLTGAVAFLDGAPVAGAPVEIQLRSVSKKGEAVLEQTLAQAVTAANGEWCVPVAIAAGTAEGISLRALCPGSASAPVAVSAPLHVPGAAAITPASAPQPTPEATAPPAT